MRDARIDLDPFVHRAGVHDRSPRAHPRDTVGGETPHTRILTERWEESRFLTLALKPQRDDRVRAVERSVEIAFVGHARRKMPAPPGQWDQRWRTRQRDPRAEREERVDIRTGDAAVQDVADDDDTPSLEIADRVPQRVRVQQPLRRVRVPSVSGVDHGGVGALGDEVRSAR